MYSGECCEVVGETGVGYRPATKRKVGNGRGERYWVCGSMWRDVGLSLEGLFHEEARVISFGC